MKRITATLLVALAMGCGASYDETVLGQAEQGISKNHRFGITDTATRCDAGMAANARCYYPNDKLVKYAVNNNGMSFFEGMSVASAMPAAVNKIAQAQGSSGLRYQFEFVDQSVADVIFLKGSVSPLVPTDDIRNFSRVQCQVANSALFEPVAIQGTHHICTRFLVTLDLGDILNRAGSGNFAAMLEHAVGFGLMGSMGAGITPVTSVTHTYTSRHVIPFQKTSAHSLQEQCIGQEFSTGFEPWQIKLDNRCSQYF